MKTMAKTCFGVKELNAITALRRSLTTEDSVAQLSVESGWILVYTLHV